MFGYIAINKPELRIREFDLYQSYYCGFCDTLRKDYGRGGQLTLSYDLTFLILLLTSLYETEDTKRTGRCIAHPFHKHRFCYNEFSEYASHMNILLSFHKCMDDWLDEHSYKKRLAALYLGFKARKVKQLYSGKYQTAAELLSRLHEIEKKREADIDEAAGCFGSIMAEIFAVFPDIWEKDLRRVGFYLGKFIYLMDAYEDIEEDIRMGNYNPLLQQYQQPGFEKECEQMLTMMLAECSRTFEKLPIVDNIEILRNILYSGVWCRYRAVKNKRGQHRYGAGTGQ